MPAPRGTLLAAGSGRFVIEPYAIGALPSLFDMEGEVRLQDQSGQSPVAAGEVVAAVSGSGLRYLGLFGIDGANATRHQVSVPLEIGLRSFYADRGHLTLEGEDGWWFSDDGGATGVRSDLTYDGLLPWVVPSARPGDRVVLLGGDGATFFPVAKVARVASDGTSAVEEVDLAAPFVLAPMVRADGRLVLVTVGGELNDPLRVWLSEPSGGFSEITPIGFESAGGMRGTISTPQGPILVADTVDQDRVLISTDGEVWKSVRTR